MRANRILLPLLGLSLLLALAPRARAEGLDALEAVLKRTSVRIFDPQRTPTDAELKQIMEAGWNTRTLDGSHPFEFIQIRDRKMLETLAGETKFAKWLAKAPAAIAVLVRTSESPSLYRENGAMAVMSMYYKAAELGLGTTFQGTANREAMKRTLGIGENLHLLSVIPVGAPMPGKKLKSPERASLGETLWAEKIGKPTALLEGTQAAAQGGKPLADLLGPTRVDVTSFAPTPVEGDKLRTAFEAMRAAPSSKNRQPWRWVLVSDPATKQRIARAAKDRTLAEAPVVAVLAAAIKPPPTNFGSQLKHDPHNNVPKGEKLIHFFQRQDLGCALANLRLGVEGQGLGVRVTPFTRGGESKARAALSDGRAISKHRMQMVAAVGIGYAKQTSAVQTPALPGARVSTERYGAR